MYEAAQARDREDQDVEDAACNEGAGGTRFEPPAPVLPDLAQVSDRLRAGGSGAATPRDRETAGVDAWSRGETGICGAAVDLAHRQFAGVVEPGGDPSVCVSMPHARGRRWRNGHQGE